MSALAGVLQVDLSVEDLYAELQEREEDLVLAGRFGKNLLEEKEGLKKDLHVLQRNYSSLEEVATVITMCAEYCQC